VASAYGWVTRVLSMVKRAHIFHILTPGNLGIQLNNYTFTRVMRQLDGAQTGPGTMFKEEAYKGCY
jgi:hypothetical protein